MLLQGHILCLQIQQSNSLLAAEILGQRLAAHQYFQAHRSYRILSRSDRYRANTRVIHRHQSFSSEFTLSLIFCTQSMLHDPSSPIPLKFPYCFSLESAHT
uniref:Uncharacterized protein n=1 Tax=Siphoviridae sp. ct96x5 TaxID=2825367 RepID=A0A8S5PSG0_9CAUD|nr:MAG TPA: hypothetical protein [Siphoviridae sp. ct96x5]